MLGGSRKLSSYFRNPRCVPSRPNRQGQSNSLAFGYNLLSAPPNGPHRPIAMFVALIKAARPHQWIKNLFVAAPLIFARRIDDPEAALRTLYAVLCFCVLSSAVYLLNDIVDVEKDRAHPVKRNRPIASGRLPIGLAWALTGGLALAALAGSAALSGSFGLVAAAYFTLNLGYSFGLKRIPVVDVLCIASGFLLRVLGGAFAIPVEASPWLLACTGLLASMLGFGKRAHELRVASAKGISSRDVLKKYDAFTLRLLIIILGAATVVVYGFYTQSAHALAFFGTRQLAFTIPSVLFGIIRFVRIVFTRLDAESPTDSMLRDRPFLLNLATYAVTILVVIYGNSGR